MRAKGIDFSHWQPEYKHIDKNEFVFFRFGYGSEGGFVVPDLDTIEQLDEISKAEVTGGYYYATSHMTAFEQFEGIVELIEEYELEEYLEIIAVDVEKYFNVLSREFYLQMRLLVAFLQAKYPNKKVILYINISLYRDMIAKKCYWVEGVDVWIAYYPTEQQLKDLGGLEGWDKFVYYKYNPTQEKKYVYPIFLQWTDEADGKLYGFESGKIDRNVSKFTLQGLLEWLGRDWKDKPIEEVEDEVITMITNQDVIDALYKIEGLSLLGRFNLWWLAKDRSARFAQPLSTLNLPDNIEAQLKDLLKVTEIIVPDKVETSPYSTKTNQDMINASSRVSADLGYQLWDFMAKAGFNNLTDNRDAIYSGLKIEALGTLSEKERVLLAKYLGVEYNKIENTGEFYLAWPTEYIKYTQAFGINQDIYKQWRLPGHEGVDIQAPKGSDIYACYDGVVYRAETNPHSSNYGIHVRVDHGNGFRTIYAHLDSIEKDIKVGSLVETKQLIGKADSTGNSNGSHLHLTLKKDGATIRGETIFKGDIIDPTPYLRAD